MIKDLFSDVFARIKNAVIKKHKIVYIEYNEKIITFLKLLITKGYISHYDYYVKKYGDSNKILKIYLSYTGQWIKIPTINLLKKEKKSSTSNFLTLTKISKNIKTFQGLYVISTTSGIMTSSEALKFKKGGKFLFYIN